MKRLLAFALLFAMAGPASASGPLNARLPAGVPDGDALGWEKITGDVESASERVVYTFYVDPARGAIYELTRYRVTRFATKDGRRTAQDESEKFVWNAHPGTGQVPLCFALGENGAWRALLPASSEYRSEMGTAIQVYGLHRSARRMR